MKLFLLFFLPCLFCFLHKKNSNLDQLKYNEIFQEQTSKAYGKQIFFELNDYRYKHFFLQKIEWKEDLFKSAHSEILEIIQKNTFGKHEKFKAWENVQRNEFLTEIAMKFKMSETQKQKKHHFAQFVVSALFKKEKKYLDRQYDYVGIAMIPTNQPTEYIVLLKLISNKQKYSCKKALEEGQKPNQITITNNGKKETLQCEQTTEGGGWTLIADVNQYAKAKALIIPIDDRGLEYTQVLFEAKHDWYLNYNYGSVNNWDFDGYNFRFNCLRFGDSWYVDRSHDGYRVKYEIFERAQDLQIITPAKKCFFGGSQQLYNCAKKFIFKAVPTYAGKLNAFSELQSASNVDLQNNIYRFSFKLYVR